MHGAFFDSPLEEIGETAIQATVSAWRRTGERGTLELAVVEDLDRQHRARRRRCRWRPRGSGDAARCAQRVRLRRRSACCSPPAMRESAAPQRSRSRPAGALRPAAAFDPGPIKTAAEYLTEPEFAAADVARGELLGFACAACHKFRAEEGTLIGPNLHGVFGRPAAALGVSTTRRRSSSPGSSGRRGRSRHGSRIPPGSSQGTTMAFTGYRSAEDRRDLIAYLLRATQ